MQDTNKKFWERYARLYKYVIEKTNTKMYNKTCEKIMKHLSKEMCIVEIGCGSGQLTRRLAKYAGKWIATDFSKNMVAEAKKNAARENVEFSVEDVTSLPYADNSVDVIVIANVLHIMPYKEKAMQEIRRVLKKGGILVAPTFVFSDGFVNKPLLLFAEMLGHKVFTKWTKDAYAKFVMQSRFSLEEVQIVQGNLQPECLVIARK